MTSSPKTAPCGADSHLRASSAFARLPRQLRHCARPARRRGYPLSAGSCRGRQEVRDRMRARHPFLDIVLAPAFEHRESEGRWISVEPDRFESRMPLRTPFFHENDFSVTDTHLVYGPYLLLPKGRFRAHYGLRLLTALPRFSGIEIVIDVTRDAGSETVAASRVSWIAQRRAARGGEHRFCQ